jgi:hypothetical protein
LASYQVDGTSLMSWRLRVEAGSESDASDHALRIAGCLSGLQWDHALLDARHQVVASRRLVETPGGGRTGSRVVGPDEGQVTLFEVSLEGESVFCSSPRCVHGLLSQGWQLADPAQTDELVRSLEREEPAEEEEDPHPRRPG